MLPALVLSLFYYNTFFIKINPEFKNVGKLLPYVLLATFPLENLKQICYPKFIENLFYKGGVPLESGKARVSYHRIPSNQQ